MQTGLIKKDTQARNSDENITVQYCTVQYNTVQYSTVQYTSYICKQYTFVL